MPTPVRPAASYACHTEFVLLSSGELRALFHGSGPPEGDISRFCGLFAIECLRLAMDDGAAFFNDGQ
jgi:hypothetical protein